MIGDSHKVSPLLQGQFVKLAAEDFSVIVRSQLACTAKRLPADDAIPIVAQLLKHDADIDDPHVPLLIWWAIEDKAISDTSTVLRLVESAAEWQRPLMQRVVLERLARRFAAEGTDAAFAACARLIQLAQTDGDVDL